MTFSTPDPTSSGLVASISAGARRFNWQRFAYLLAMAGAAGAAIALLLLASSTAYAAAPAVAVLPEPAFASEPSAMFEELRDNFLVWSLLLGSVRADGARVAVPAFRTVCGRSSPRALFGPPRVCLSLARC